MAEPARPEEEVRMPEQSGSTSGPTPRPGFELEHVCYFAGAKYSEGAVVENKTCTLVTDPAGREYMAWI